MDSKHTTWKCDVVFSCKRRVLAVCACTCDMSKLYMHSYNEINSNCSNSICEIIVMINICDEQLAMQMI